MKLLCVPFLLAIVANQIDAATDPPGCYSFDSDTNGWDLTPGPFFWKWSGNDLPDLTNNQAFYEKSGAYMWFQDQENPPQQGAMTSDPSVPLTLKHLDTVTASIWRNIIDGKANDTDRPILRFVTGASVQNVLYASEYNMWETVTVTCDTTGSVSAKTAVCCDGGSYPCSGYFRVEGEVLIRNELLVFDQLEINSDCSGPTPSTCSCDFNSVDVCDWSPSLITTGWIWSGTFPTTLIPPPPSSSEFIYIIDTSAQAYSQTITGVDDASTTFELTYYLDQSTAHPNRLAVSFRTPSYVAYFSPDPPALSAWNTVTYSCASTVGGCCGGSSPCNGNFYVETTDYVYDFQYAAIDDFHTGGGSCGPPTASCSCDFDTSGLCSWSPSVITTGWLWSSTFPTSLIPPSPSGSSFIYIIDTSARAYSPLITGVDTSLTTFTFNYYFDTDTSASPNNIAVYFTTTTGSITYFSPGLPLTPSWSSVTFSCAAVSCCGVGVPSCDGTFSVETTNSVRTFLYAAIDDFAVAGAGVC